MTSSTPTDDGQAPLDLETFAGITADIEAGVPAAEAIAKRGVTARRWERAQVVWSRTLADDAMADGPLAAELAAHLARARAALPLVAMTPEEWAALTLDVAARGAGLALAARGLSASTYFRLAKHWAEVLPRDAALAARHAAALYAAARSQSG